MAGLIKARTVTEYKTGGGKPRNYKNEYKKFHSSPKAIAERSSRNKARRKMAALGKVKKGDKKDVHHIGSKYVKRSGIPHAIHESRMGLRGQLELLQ